jgi:two-component system, OmpR family, sensor kinase
VTVGRLYSRIYFHFLGVLVVVGLAASLVFAFGQRGALQRHVGERLARHVGSLVAEHRDDSAALGQRLAQLHADLEVDVTVRNLDGRVVAAAGAPLRELTGPEWAELRAGAVITRARPDWFVAGAARDPAGVVRGYFELSAPRHMGMPGLWRPALGVGFVLLLVALAAGPLARRISKPVERLTEGARRLGEGDLGYRVPLDSRDARHGALTGRTAFGLWRRRMDELGDLTRAFNDMAERVERLVHGQQELLANVSHELRSPLARIRVALALLPRDGDTEGRLRDVETDLGELDRLIEDVLTTARLDATGLPRHPVAVDVPALLAELRERAAHDPVTAGTRVEVAPGPMPDLTADPALLKRALWNLVENAAKYGAPPITLAARRDGEVVRLSVADWGEGIAPAERERVLAPFYRLDRARTPSAAGEAPHGFGLGLTLARRVAEAHGGGIVIEPAAVRDGRDEGCRVTLVLPAPAASPR